MFLFPSPYTLLIISFTAMHAICTKLFFLATFSLLFLLSIVCMYIFLALLIYLHM